jgi:predicted TIM-barrel fold metal-dependent hydrolase
MKEQLDQHHIVLGLVSGSMEIAAVWHGLAPSQIVAGALLPCEGGRLPNSRGRRCFANGAALPDLTWLRAEIKAGRIGFLGEITSQYAAMPPTDPRLEPYFALAEELDVPVGIHMGPGPPGAIYPNGVCGPEPCAPNYRAALSNPLLLEEVLARHKRLRVWVMHAGWPLKEDMLHLLYSHPQVYVDIAVLEFVTPRKTFEAYVCDLADHGFGKRIMWGSDFPQFDKAIDSLEAVSCLSPEQKRDIFYNNAATFLGLPELPVR